MLLEENNNKNEFLDAKERDKKNERKKIDRRKKHEDLREFYNGGCWNKRTPFRATWFGGNVR